MANFHNAKYDLTQLLSVVIPESLHDMELHNEGVTAARIFPLQAGQCINLGGVKQKVEVLQLQAYLKEDGNGCISPHKEGSNVTEIYFPLVGSVEVSLETSFSSNQMGKPSNADPVMSGVFDFDRIKGKTLVLDGTGIDPICVLDEQSIEAVVLPPRLMHGTSSDPECSIAVFLAAKLMPVG